MEATQSGNLDQILALMSDDVVFLTPGRPPMSRQEFLKASTPPPGSPPIQIKATSEIQEIRILGDWAFLWQALKVVIHPKPGMEPITRSGHTLSLFQKQKGRWALARDANLLTTVKSEGS